MPLPDLPPLSVLEHFAPHTRGLTWTRVPGGFSGASVWRGADDLAPRVALKAWPAGTSLERLRQIHAWMAAARGLSFVPEVLHGAGGSATFTDDHIWDCCRWRSGSPRPAPTAEEVAAACEAVARLHNAWAALVPTQRGPCPGVQNRLRILVENESLIRAGPDSLPPVSAQLDPLLRRAVAAVVRAAPVAVGELRYWERHEFALRPCVRDLRGEHVLFSGHAVTGIIDFGAAGVDHPACDLARLLGDLSDADASLFAAGLSAYRALRPTFDAPDAFVRLLASTGAVCSVLGWLVRLVVRREPVPDTAATAARLSALVARVDRSGRA
ncbi:MAG: phosphotransferase [Planctomycetes bacterium]|nr:phosphotransferase [Planctomycetota bacterium]